MQFWALRRTASGTYQAFVKEAQDNDVHALVCALPVTTVTRYIMDWKRQGKMAMVKKIFGKQYLLLGASLFPSSGCAPLL
jgi:hypothetical protein